MMYMFIFLWGCANYSCSDSKSTLKGIQVSVYPKDTYPKDFTKKRILIDPGHGCEDPGTSNPDMPEADNESQYNWKLANVTKDHLNATGRFEAFLTRETEGVGEKNIYCLSRGNKNINLAKRAAMAKEKNIDAFLSIHADHSARKTSAGTWIIWSQHKKSKDYAEQNEILANSMGAAVKASGRKMYFKDFYYDELSNDPDLDKKGYLTTNARYGVHIDHKKGLALLKNVEKPAILIETHFMSNKAEITAFHNEEAHKNFAKAFEHGLITYFAHTEGKHDIYKDVSSAYYTIQILATPSENEADEVIKTLKSKGFTVRKEESVQGDNRWFRVRVGEFKDMNDALLEDKKIESLGYTDTWIVHEQVAK